MSRLLVVAERALPDPGGLAVATSRIAAQAAGRGEEVHLARLAGDLMPGSRGRAVRGEVTVHPVGRLERDDETLSIFNAHLRELMRELEVDLVHALYAGRAAYAATLAARELGIPSVVSLRGNDLDRGIYRGEDLAFVRETLLGATLVTAVSRALAESAGRLFRREVQHVTNSVDVELFRALPRDEALAAELGLMPGPVLGFSGELREKKGIRFLLPAFADVARRRPLSLLLIGGARKDATEALEAFRRSAPDVASRVHVTEYQRSPERLNRLLALCDAMIFPSLWEGTPNAVLEAMAAERAVLATDVGGHPDLIRHGETGFLLRLADLDRLPGAIEELVDLAPERRAAIGRAAREHVASAHAPEAESRAYAAVYERARTPST